MERIVHKHKYILVRKQYEMSIKYLSNEGSIGVVFDSHVPDLLPEDRCPRCLVGLRLDTLRDFTPVALTTHVLTLYTELILEALDQARDLIFGLNNLLGGH